MQQNQTSLPDIAKNHPVANPKSLQWVGMEKIGIPIKLSLANGDVTATSAKADVFVSLDTAAKGIHMSRLYLKLNELLANQIVTQNSLNTLLDSMLQSHIDISKSAMVRLAFDLPIHKKALLSDNYGFQLYSVVLTKQIIAGKGKTELELTIPYSSTCPCSASLATQLNAEAIQNHFQEEMVSKADLVKWLTSGEASLATPHNQRSYAYIKLDIIHGHTVDIDTLIFQLEDAIGTPVQTAVKREDEQEFARLNGNNLLFCEDAGRRIKQFLEDLQYVEDYWFKVEHQESLHAHNAVVIDQKQA